MEITSAPWWASRPFRLVSLVLLLGFLFGVALLLGGDNAAKAAPACTISWTGGGGSTSWFTAANWDQNRLPATSDNVCIPATSPAVTVTYDQNQSSQILNLQSQQALAVSTGELTVTETTQTSTISNTLTWSGGTLGGAGDVAVAGPVSWSGGTKAGTGTLTANGGMTISGTDGKEIAGGRVDNPAGQTTVINGTGAVSMGSGSTFSNEGTVDDQVDVAFGGLGPDRATSASFNNSGTFTKTGVVEKNLVGGRVEETGNQGGAGTSLPQRSPARKAAPGSARAAAFAAWWQWWPRQAGQLRR
jgi:hypothetical protein